MSYDPIDYSASGPLPGDAEAARNRVKAPAIILIVVGVLNVLLALTQIGRTVWIAVTPAQDILAGVREQIDQLEKMGIAQPGFFKAALEEQGASPDAMKNKMLTYSSIISLLWFLIALVSLLGGIRMVALRSYGLCLAGAICAAIPCLSCGGCCGLGEIVGLWSLIVLLNPEVKASFR